MLAAGDALLDLSRRLHLTEILDRRGHGRRERVLMLGTAHEQFFIAVDDRAGLEQHRGHVG